MLIACQKFRSRIIGYYIRSCHIITCTTCKTRGLIYSRAMRTLPTSCHVVPHVQSHHACITRRVHAGKPATLCICGMPGLLMDVPFMQAKQYLSKLTASHFSTLNTKFANQNVLERILIAMLNENKADWNENFRICAEEPIVPLYKQ